MFITNIHGLEALTAKGAKHGLKVGDIVGAGSNHHASTPAIGGDTFAIKDQIKAAGGRWNGLNKVWAFASWKELEDFINTL